MSGHQAASGMTDRYPSPTPTPTPKERSNPISAGHSALWGSSSRRRDGPDGRTRGERQTTFLPAHPQLGKQNKDRPPPPPRVATTLATETFLFPGAVWPPAPAPAPMTKKRHLESQRGLPASTDGGGGCRREEPPPLTRAATLGREKSGKRRPPPEEARLERGWGYLEVAAFVEGVRGSEDGNLPVVEVGLIHQGDPEALHRFLLQGFQLKHQGLLRTSHLLLGHRGGGGGGAGPGPQSSRTGRAGPGPSPALALGRAATGPGLHTPGGPDQAPDGPWASPVPLHTTRAGPSPSPRTQAVWGEGWRELEKFAPGPGPPPPGGGLNLGGGERRWNWRKAAEGRRW